MGLAWWSGPGLGDLPVAWHPEQYDGPTEEEIKALERERIKEQVSEWLLGNEMVFLDTDFAQALNELIDDQIERDMSNERS